MTYHLNLSRALYVPRELVFDAWTEAEHLTGWYSVQLDDQPRAQVEAVADGRIELCWHDADGRSWWERGVFEHIESPKGFDANLTLEAPDGDTVATRLQVRLVDQTDACRIELRHDGFASEEARDQRREAWLAMLDRLEAYFSSI